MEAVLLAVGNTDIPWVAESLGLYASRIVHYIPFQVKEIPQPKGTSSLPPEQVKLKEGQLILKALAPGDYLVLLDEHGQEFRSAEFASWLSSRMVSGVRRLVFAVGGAWGFSPEVYARASAKIALSRMTFPHQMVRTIFAEQLYRALTILKGEPYHNE